MSAGEAGAGESFRLRRGATPIVLEDEGFHHAASSRGGGHLWSRYADLTHVLVTPRALWIGTRRSVHPLGRGLFRDPADPERLREALLARVARGPRGAERLARMSELDRRAQEQRRPLATWSVAAICVLVFALQLGLGSEIFEVGYFSPALFADGDPWRALCAGLLHGFWLHLAVNLAGLLVVGRLAERALGTARLLCVMGASQLGSMTASALTDAGGVVGISGVVFGLVGALLLVELRRADQLPASWRFPRFALVVVIAGILVDAALGLALPLIAGEAHLGGFAAGLATAALLTRIEPLGAPAGTLSRVGATAVVALALLSVGGAAAALLAAEDYRAQHAARIAALPGIPPEELNNHAWLIATLPGATREQLEAALRLAERAVALTRHADPTLLDTLAEVNFQLGRPDLAVLIIDEAIERAPEEPYYREQRRRFTGERHRDDRPPDPMLPWPSPAAPPLPPDSDGLTV